MIECECNKTECEAVKYAVLEMIDCAEEWMTPWLVFDEDKMRKIGMRKLNIVLECQLSLGMDDGYFDDEYIERDRNHMKSMLKNKSAEWMKERAECWSNIDPRCNVEVKNQYSFKQYTA